MMDIVRRPKVIAFEVSDEFRSKVKIQAAVKGKSLREYLISLIENDINNGKEE